MSKYLKVTPWGSLSPTERVAFVANEAREGAAGRARAAGLEQGAAIGARMIGRILGATILGAQHMLGSNCRRAHRSI